MRMPKQIRHDVVGQLRELAQRTSLRGGNPYRARPTAAQAASPVKSETLSHLPANPKSRQPARNQLHFHCLPEAQSYAERCQFIYSAKEGTVMISKKAKARQDAKKAAEKASRRR